MACRAMVLFLVLLLWPCGELRSQQEFREYPDRSGKFFLVPEFWLSFGSRTYIDIAPMVGYHINDRTVAGLGPHYIFQSWKGTYYQSPGQTHIFGLKGFLRFALITNAEQYLPINLFSDLFAHVEYEALSLENQYYGRVSEGGRFLYNALLLGGGFNQRIGPYSSVSFMVLWNVNESSSSPYSNPVFRIGFNTYF